MRLRRLLARLTVIGVIALTLVVSPGVVFRLVEGSVVDVAELRWVQTSGESAVSDIGDVAPFEMIGVRFDGVPDGPVLVRWRDGTAWSEWTELEFEADKAPDPATTEAVRASQGVTTEPLWIGQADAFQVESSDAMGAEVLTVRTVRRSVVVDEHEAGAQSAGRPPIQPRSAWNARPPSSSVSAAGSLRLAVVHHSATASSYSRSEVPGILRSIQAFHMDGNGWSDIGYNFVVDRFGTVWEGRHQSLNQNSIGAHASGFNTGSVGVVALGNTSASAATTEQITGISEVVAWRFAASGIDPTTTVRFTSGGSSTIPAGAEVTLPRVIGHRDVGSTDCPGATLYAALSSRIRPALPALVAAKASPVGSIDIAAAGPRSVVVSGWTLDPLLATPIEVHVYVNGVETNLGPTNVARSDVAARFVDAPLASGFTVAVGGLSPGIRSVCVFGINTGPGSNTLIGCRDLEVLTGDPIGALDLVRAGPDGRVAVSGWALDPDSNESPEIHVYVNGQGTNLGPAAGMRSDIGGAFPGFGSSRGFSWAATGFSPGGTDVCVFAVNRGPGSNRLLGCRSVTVPGGSPVGVVDVAAAGPDGTIAISGWAVDPDVAAGTEVHVYVDDAGVNLGPTVVDRADVAGQFPEYGVERGFAWMATGYAPGSRRVCVFAVNRGVGSNSLLSCRRVVVPGGNPFGSVDNIKYSNGRVSVSGWAIDPDTRASIEAHIHIDGVGYNTGPAQRPRPDVAATVPDYGSDHGLDWVSPLLAGPPRSVCVFAINRGTGGDQLLTCRAPT